MKDKRCIMPDLPRPSSRLSVLGMILKGYPRISETFISNEILLLENLGFKTSVLPFICFPCVAPGKISATIVLKRFGPQWTICPKR